jgi:hypothetical protein
MDLLEKDPAGRPPSADAVSSRLEEVHLTSAWSEERAEEWWSEHRPRSLDSRPVAEMLLSHEGHELRIGPKRSHGPRVAGRE